MTAHAGVPLARPTPYGTQFMFLTLFIESMGAALPSVSVGEAEIDTE